MRARSGAAPGGVPCPPALPRQPEAGESCSQSSAKRPRAAPARPRWPPAGSRARAGRRRLPRSSAQSAARAPDRRPRSASIPTARSSCRCSSTRQHRSPPRAARRDRRLPRPLPQPRRARRRRRPSRGRARSGKRKAACFRWACNKRLRSAFCTLADTTRHWTPGRRRYAAAEPAATTTSARIRTVSRAWCRVVWRCWQDRTPYDPARHRGLQPHCTVTIPTSSGPARPRCHPADARRRRHRTRRPAGPSAKRLTTSRHPLSRWRLTQDVLQVRPAGCKSSRSQRLLLLNRRAEVWHGRSQTHVLVVQTGSGAEPIPDPARPAPICTNVSVGADRRPRLSRRRWLPDLRESGSGGDAAIAVDVARPYVGRGWA